MAELLVIAHDQIGADVYQTAKRYKRGDVVTVQEDGWNWGRDELALPIFRILKLPNVDVATASTMLSWEQPVAGTNAPVSTPQAPVSPASMNNTCQRRKLNLDLDSPLLAPDLAAYIADDARKAAAHSSPLDLTTFGNLQAVKAVVADPALIGPPPAVL